MTGGTLTPCTRRPGGGGAGDAHAVHGADAHAVHAWDAVRARMRARATGADPLSAPRSSAGPAPGPVTPGTVPGPALADVAARAGCRRAGGCPYRVPCVGPCHASTVAGRAPGPTDRKRDPAPTTTNRRQDAPRASDPSVDGWAAAVPAPAWLAALLRADAARPVPVPPPAVPPPAFRRPELPGACLAGPAGHRADACPDVAGHVRAELRRAYRAEARRALIGAPGAPPVPLVGIPPEPAPTTLTPCTPRPGRMPADGPLTSTDAPPAADRRPVPDGPTNQPTPADAHPMHTLTGQDGPDHARALAAGQAARVRAALTDLTDRAGPGALTATHQPPSPAQQARMAADAARAADARARADLADELPDACPVHGYPHALPCPHDPQDGPPAWLADVRVPIPPDALPQEAPRMATEHHAPGCPEPHPLGTLCHATRPRAQHGTPLSTPRSAMSAPAQPDTPDRPQEARTGPDRPQDGPDRPRALPGQPMPTPTGPRTTAPRPHICTRPEHCADTPQDERPTWVAATAAALGVDPGPALAALPQESPPTCPERRAPCLWQCDPTDLCPPLPAQQAAHAAAGGAPEDAPGMPARELADRLTEHTREAFRPGWQDRARASLDRAAQEPDQEAPRVTLTAGHLHTAPLGTAAPYEAPEPCAMAPYAPPGPDDAAPGNPWRDLGILAGPLPTGPQDGPDDERARIARALDVPPATLTGPTLAELRHAELADVRPDLAALTSRALTGPLAWPTDALRNAFRALGIDLPRAAAERARQDEAAARRRGHMRDLHARARARRSGRPLPATLDPQGA